MLQARKGENKKTNDGSKQPSGKKIEEKSPKENIDKFMKEVPRPP